MEAEILFLKYAFPCTFVKVQRGTVRQDELDELEKIMRSDGTVSRERLERIYDKAAIRMGRLAKELGKDKWDFGLVADFFRVYHNRIIEEGQGIYAVAPEGFKDLCRIHSATVVGVNSDVLSVTYEYNGKPGARCVLNHLVPTAKPGDRVRIHYGYAVEFV